MGESKNDVIIMQTREDTFNERHTKIFKDLTYIFNKWLSDCPIPAEWEVINVSSMYKKTGNRFSLTIFHINFF